MLNKHLFSPNIAFEEAADQGGESDDEESQTGKDLESIEDYEAALKEARTDAAKQRTKRKEIEGRVSELETLEEKFNKFKNVFGEDEDPDPEALKKKTENLESQLETERKKNAVTIQAISAGLDPDLTIAYLQNKGKLSKLDASDSEAVGSLIDEVADEKPALKTQKADSVGTGGGGNDDSDPDGKDLNPIDQYRKKLGILHNSK